MEKLLGLADEQLASLGYVQSVIEERLGSLRNSESNAEITGSMSECGGMCSGTCEGLCAYYYPSG
jgi:hypothetical protein